MSDLTFKKLSEVQRQLLALAPPPRFDSIVAGPRARAKLLDAVDPWMIQPDTQGGGVKSVMGLNLIPVPHQFAPRRPVLQISRDFEHCSPEFRAAWNAWALERFGTEECAYLIDAAVLRDLQRSMTLSIDRSLAAAVMHGYSSAGDGPCPAP